MVLAIVGVMVLAVGLSVDSGGAQRRVSVEAQRLVSLVHLACDESAQLGQEIGVRFDSGGYVFLRAIGRTWEARSGDALRARRLPAGMRIELVMGDRPIDLDGEPGVDGGPRADTAAARVNQDQEPLAPHLACDVDGSLSAADPRIAIHAGERSAAIGVGEDGALRIETEDRQT